MECTSLWNASHNGPSAIGTPDWLQRLERGENVVVIFGPMKCRDGVCCFRPAAGGPRAGTIAADLDTLSLVPNDPHADKASNHHDPRARHRYELAESPPKPKKLSHREQRTALRAALGLPPHKKIVFRKLNALVSAVLGSIAPKTPNTPGIQQSRQTTPLHTNFKRRKGSGTLARAGASGLPVRCVGLARQFIAIWFDHTQFSPSLPMASTGHPSMASLQSASSSGVVGCLNT